ncbi:MAG: hypothetical protein BroJett026_35300 [Betaproteobacteria bacterium]|nr:MAG: hypothetical protein BroJett026_35300 [Betaproteobacteria bacterium]
MALDAVMQRVVLGRLPVRAIRDTLDVAATDDDARMPAAAWVCVIEVIVEGRFVPHAAPPIERFQVASRRGRHDARA